MAPVPSGPGGIDRHTRVRRDEPGGRWTRGSPWCPASSGSRLPGGRSGHRPCTTPTRASLAEPLQAMAWVEGRSVSDVVREAIAELVEQRRRDKRFRHLLEKRRAASASARAVLGTVARDCAAGPRSRRGSQYGARLGQHRAGEAWACATGGRCGSRRPSPPAGGWSSTSPLAGRHLGIRAWCRRCGGQGRRDHQRLVVAEMRRGAGRA